MTFAVLCAVLNYGAANADEQATTEIRQIVEQSNRLITSGHPDDAIPLLRSAIARLGTTPAAYTLHFELGNALSDKTDYQNAVAEYQTCLGQKPNFPPALINLAYTLVNLGQLDKAKPIFEQFLSQNPNAPNKGKVKTQLLLAEAAESASKARYFDAKGFLEEASRLDPTNPLVHFKLARAVDELGDTERGIKEYEQALRLKPNYDAAAFNIAGCYQTLGQTEDAVYWFQQYLAINPNSADRATVLNMITKLREHRKELTADPRSPDYIQSVAENGRLVRWAYKQMPLKVFIAGNKTNEYRDAYRDILIDSMNEWSKASQQRLKFVLVKNAKKADIVCDWTNNPYDVRRTGTDVEQGICFSKVIQGGQWDGTIQSSTVRILMIDPVSGKPLSDDSMKVTCLHEFGHAIGLRGHSNNNHDVMFYSVSPTVWLVLSKRDKATIYRLYQAFPVLPD